MATAFEPLEGIRVVDVTSSLAGPYCTEILGALGADVVKVEHPEHGDEARAWGAPFFEGSSVMFYAANLSKRSLALDLKRGRDVLLRLVDSADVFLQSLRPGTAARLGLGPGELRERNPGLVYCDIGAFGRAGPLRERPGYDPLLQAFAGIMSVTGEPDRPGVRVGASIVDQGTGMWAALGILAARIAGERQADVLGRLEQAGVPAAPVNDVGQVADHEQTAELGLIQPMPEPTVALPLSLDGERVLHRSPPPRLGEHTVEILEELGYSAGEIAHFAAEHVIRRVESAG